MKFLRLLRRRLHRQLALIHEGKVVAARTLSVAVADAVSLLESSPPEGDPHAIRFLHAQCQELNDLVLRHFESEQADLAEEIFKLEVERKIKEFLK